MKRIVLTGGGTAGHVTPNLALLPELRKAGYQIFYIGSYNGIERKLIEEQGIPYYGISSGKLRRYLDIKNFTDPFRVLKGCHEARILIKKIKPDIIFSKGGFVSVPVVFAAKHFHIPIIIHESDMTPGLANKLSIPCANRVCCNFPETIKQLPQGKAVLSGSPIRKELMQGQKNAGLLYAGLSSYKPVICIIGGSQGSAAINQAVRSVLPKLLPAYQVIHLCGKDNLDPTLTSTKGYAQFEYVKDELKDVFAASDLIISRAGANAICEILALRKPNILIPLSQAASRGDQILNAASFEKQGFSRVIHEENLTGKALLTAIKEVSNNREQYVQAMERSTQTDSVRIIIDLIKELTKPKTKASTNKKNNPESSL